MKTIEDWIIVELSNIVINGIVDNRNTYTDKLILLKDGYAVTENNIYKLGKSDKIWIATQAAQNYIKDFT